MQNAQRLSIILLLCCLSHAAFSQGYLYIGTQRYPSIYVGLFRFPGDVFFRRNFSAPALSVEVAKRNGGGWLVISTYCQYCDCGFFSRHFAGDVYLYLSDGSVIKCYDRGLRDCLNDDIIGIYMLSAAEVMRLKQHSIESIRFTIGPPKNVIGGRRESFIATSSEDTRQPIRQLFGN
ncbi:hypothetical protein FHS56_000636 [Thermonema lapsum]|uniref:Uncharacterized protein n=1 Tax=Thermonema lapsum TaxID=28195 RepID=A0A846MP26_9BACT|nr:hypothetical protein [Thermonema lapsum]NIK73150.1 hypothetical protein [Thermonema lapsum]